MPALILAVLLAGLFAASGILEALKTTKATAGGTHLGVPAGVNQSIGIFELGCAAAFLIGLRWPPSLIGASAGLLVLIVAAVAFHLKAADPLLKALPAVIAGAASALLLVMTLRG